MKLFPVRWKLGWRSTLALGGIFAAAFAWQRFASANGRRRQLPGPTTDSVPQTAGAKSAVTGGAPEDINGMPPVPMENPLHASAPIYDGSHLEAPMARERRR